MSIPAIIILDEIKLDFQMIHLLSIEMIQTNVKDKKFLELENLYQEDKDSFDESLEKYYLLSYVKNSEGKEYAPLMMQSQMKNYVSLMKQEMENNDEIIKQYVKGDITSFDALPQLASVEHSFHEVLEEDTQMEIRGMENMQSKVEIIENNMNIVFFSSAIIAIVIAIVVIILTSKFVSIPIKRLIGITKIIAKGEPIEIDSNSKNSDVKDVLISLNQMSKELEKYKEKILMQEKLSSIGELGSRLAHDIRNPLTVIKGTLDVIKMQNQNLTEEDKERFDRVDDSVYRIAHQIDNVLDFIKEKPLKLATHSLNEIIDSSLKDIPNTKDVRIEKDSSDLQIQCDYEAIKIVIINLVINSIQEMKGQGEIKISSKNIDNKIIIQIQDSGPGIPEESLEKVFEPLFTTKQEGTGLGLASCKSLVEKHQGTISVKNNPTRFIIELPNQKSD
jgi:signal transduction histidine kinase